MLSFRFARVPMPTMPTSAEELRNDNQQIDGASLRERTVYAQRYATGLVAGVGMVALVALTYLATDDDWVAVATALTLSLTLIMRARVFQGLGQRLWLLLSGLTGIVVFVISHVAGLGGVAAIAAVMGLLWRRGDLGGSGPVAAGGKAVPVLGARGGHHRGPADHLAVPARPRRAGRLLLGTGPVRLRESMCRKKM